jgi:hypothetical protein
MPPKGWKKGKPWTPLPKGTARFKKKLGAPTKKVLWPIMLPENGEIGWDRVRGYAIAEGLSISGALTAIFKAAGMPNVGFEPPPEGTSIRASNTTAYKGGTYFILREYANRMEAWKQQGLSNTYLVIEIVRRGFDAMQREGKVPPYTESEDGNMIRHWKVGTPWPAKRSS